MLKIDEVGFEGYSGFAVCTDRCSFMQGRFNLGDVVLVERELSSPYLVVTSVRGDRMSMQKKSRHFSLLTDREVDDLRCAGRPIPCRTVAGQYSGVGVAA